MTARTSKNGSRQDAAHKKRFREMTEEAGISDDAANGDASLFPPIITAAELASAPLRKPKELIRGILHQGEKMVLGGSSKTNKTWSCVDLALSVATGSDWWGFSTTQSRVLYVNFEIQEYHMQKRLKRVCESKKLEVPTNLDFWNLRGHACSAENFVRATLKLIGRGKYGLILIDPIYKCLGDRNENDASDIADLCNRFEKLAVKSGAAVVYAAHFSKGNQAGKSSIDRIGGSGVWARDADTIVTITQHQEDDAYVVETTVRNFKAVEPFCLRWQHPLMVSAPGLDTKKLRSGRPSKFTDKDLLKALSSDGMTTTKWQEKVIAETGMSSSTFKIIYRRLKNAGAVELSGDTYRRATDWDAPAAA